MIHFVRLFLWLRWKLLRGYLKEIRAQGTLSSVSAAVSALMFVIAAVVLLLIAGGLAIGAVPVAIHLTRAEEAATATATLRIALAVLLVVLIVLPALRAGRGSFGKGSAGIGRLLLLPISRRKLHSLEVLGSLADPLLLAALPALVVIGLVLALTINVFAALVVLLAVVAMLMTCMAWSALISVVMQLLFRDRRRAEFALLVTFILTIGLSFMPAFFSVEHVEDTAARRSSTTESSGGPPPAASVSENEAEAITPDDAIVRTDPTQDSDPERWNISHYLEYFPVWLQWIPSESFSRTLNVAAKGHVLRALPSLFALVSVALLCWLVSQRLWDRLLRSPEGGRQRASSAHARSRTWDLPLVSLHSSTVAYATARGFLRTVRGKLAVVTVPMMILLMGSVFSTGRALADIGGPFGFLLNDSSFLLSVALLFSLLNALPILANAFATDGAGFTLQALTPLSTRQLVWGKAVGALVVYLICLLPALALAALMARPGALIVVDAFVRGFGAFAIATAAGIWSSSLWPKAVDLSALNNKGNPHPLSQVVTMIVIGVTVLLGSFGGLAGRLLLGAGLGRLVGTTVVAALFCLLAWPLITTAARALEQRWESVVVAASG